MNRWLLVGCVLIACRVPDKAPSGDAASSLPGEVPEVPHDDAGTTTADAQSAPDAGTPPIACDDDHDCKEPPDRCIDEDYLMRYKDAKCVAGACVFSHEIKYCDDGCEDDECD